MIRRPCCHVLILIVIGLAGAAGLAASPFQGKTACIFPLTDFSPAEDRGERQGPLTDAVQQGFESAGFRVVAPGRWKEEAARLSLKPEDLAGGPAAVAVAVAVKADLAVSGYYAIRGDRILVAVQCYDARASTLIAGFTRTWRFNIGFYNSLHTQLTDLLEKVSFSPAPRLASLAEDVRVPQITFTCPQEGLEVLVEGQVSAGRITSGALTYGAGGLKAGMPLRVEKRLEGYHTAWETVVAAPQIPLAPLPKMDRKAWEVNWTLGQVAGAGGAFRLYAVPNWLMIGFSDYLYAQVPSAPNAAWVLHNDASLNVGQYIFFGPESPFRVGLSAGIGWILSAAPGASVPPHSDNYVNLLSPWCEWQTGGMTLLARVELKYALGVGQNALDTGIMHWGGFFPPVTLGLVLPW